MMTEQTRTPAPDHDNEHGAMLAALRFQYEAGADEAIEAMPTAQRMAEAAASVAMKAAKADIAYPATADKPPARNTALDSLDKVASLTELAEACAGFDCDLRRTATNMVFSSGNPGAPLMLVGEAPGAEEDRKGEAFVGASGQLLDRMLASIGLDRSRVYITNIVNWRPPGNRTPTAEEVALFLPIIKKHIALVAPKLLFAIGGSAAQTLLGTEERILKLRGCWHDYIMEDGRVIPLLPTLHPSYLLKSPGQKHLAWQDLRLMRHALDGLQSGDAG